MLEDLITRAALEKLAGLSTFRRGEEYFSAGVVERLRVTGDKITASVDGTDTYRVALRNSEGHLDGDCTCPHAADGNFCKHCVAVGLAWLASHSPAPKSAKPAKQKPTDPWRDIKAYLTGQPSEALIKLLLDMAERDDQLYQSLLLKAEQTSTGGDVDTAFRRAIKDATHVNGYIDWREAGSFAAKVDRVVDSMAELLKPDTTCTLVDLAEYAIECLERCLEEIDDSNGEIGDTVTRLGELHLKACNMARSDPAGLAERLFHLETTLSFGLCSFDATTYRDALGTVGLRRYRELAEAEWKKLKTRDANDTYDSRRSVITRIMERLAEADGDVNELVAIKSQDLTIAYRYLEIAEIWSKAGQPDKALEWAERGLKAFPARPDNRLRDFVVTACLKRKRNDDALQLTWIQFEEQPSLEYYKKLHGVAEKLGVWLAQRQRALAMVSDVIARKAAETNRLKPKPSEPEYALRIDIALWENDLDAAWAAVHQGTRNQGLLIALAGKLESSRANDAISLYRRVIPPIIEQTNNSAYEEAIKLIRKTGNLMKAQNQSAQFGNYLAELRLQFKPKRNFIKLLDGVARAGVVNR